MHKRRVNFFTGSEKISQSFLLLLFWVSTDFYRVIVQRVLKFVEKWKGTAIVLVNKLTKGLKNGLLYDETVHFLYIKFTK